MHCAAIRMTSSTSTPCRCSRRFRDPPTVRDFYAFEQHVRTARQRRGLEMDPDWYELPVFYFSNPVRDLRPGRRRRDPAGSAEMDYELEVAAVVGMGGADLDPEEAERNIAGYCVMNDWSARDIQRREMKLSMGPVKGKDFATSIGPVLVTPDELEDTRRNKSYDLAMTATVNGVEYSRASLADIFWSFGEMLAYASRGTRVETGRRHRFRHVRHRLHPRAVHGARRRSIPVAATGRRRRAERRAAGERFAIAWSPVRRCGRCDEHHRRLPRAPRRRRSDGSPLRPRRSRRRARSPARIRDSGERWDRGQVWAHLAEFIPYWIAQAGPVLRGQASGEPVPFGRTKSDPERIGAIERDRREPVSVLWATRAATSPRSAAFLATIGRRPVGAPRAASDARADDRRRARRESSWSATSSSTPISSKGCAPPRPSGASCGGGDAAALRERRPARSSGGNASTRPAASSAPGSSIQLRAFGGRRNRRVSRRSAPRRNVSASLTVKSGDTAGRPMPGPVGPSPSGYGRLVPIAGSWFCSPLSPYQNSTTRNARMQPTKTIRAAT